MNDRLITESQAEAMEKCLGHNIPFALFALPGWEECRFFASAPDASGESHAFTGDDAASHTGDTFFISMFDSDEPYVAGVRDECDENSVLELLKGKEMFEASLMLPYRMSTRRESYSGAFDKLRKRVTRLGGKVVLSRHEAIFSSRALTDVARDFFGPDDGTFRYICFTPETGVWLGATPELLLESDMKTGTFHTMALAGTMPIESAEEWDDKNILEHRYVSDYIAGELRGLGLEVDVKPTEELLTGIVRHLCTPIEAKGKADPMDVIDTLNPTPAVAGIPVDLAIAEIDTFESHRRRCYSGVVGAKLDGDIHAYVNLRCAFMAHAEMEGVSGWLYNLYSGGGLMPDSREEDEWAETEAKMAMLATAIEFDGHDTVKNYDLRNAKFTQYKETDHGI